MIDKAIQVCFLLFHNLTPLLSKNVYLDVDLCSSRSPAQTACEQPISTILCLDNKKNSPQYLLDTEEFSLLFSNASF